MIVAAMVAQVPSVAAMRHHRRVLIVTAPSAADPQLAVQRRTLAGWRSAGEDRDVSVVEVIGEAVTGASDSAANLRGAHHLATGEFAVVLIGKDGHEAKRSSSPIAADTLQSTIDAMPMRRAGQR